MKKLFILPILVLFTLPLLAQNVGINNDSPSPNAALDIAANDKGILIPRMTEAERIAIAPAPADEGLMVYQNDGSAGFYYWDGGAWTQVGAGGGVVSSGFNSGFSPDVFDGSDWNFSGGTVTITITESGQKVLVTSHKAFGSTTGADDLDMAIGYRMTGTMAEPTVVGAATYNQRVQANTRVPMGLSAIISSLAPGTYEVGLIVRSSSTDWNSNEYGYTTAIVFEE